MTITWMHAIAIIVVAVMIVCVSVIPLANRWRKHQSRRASDQFRRRRKMLEAQFFELAKSLGKPRGLRWRECEWSDDVTFARNKTSKMLTAFVGINIYFEAIEGGDMEDVAAVSTIRDAVAVFHYYRGSWGTGGKALFNMNPRDALEKLVAQFEPVRMV